MGKQKEFSFTFVPKREEMGAFDDERKFVFLSEKFISEKLNPQQTYQNSTPNEPPTNVICPFCREGRLKLKTVEPRYSGGPNNFVSKKDHVGNDYEYGCTQCEASFKGSVTWMYID